MNVSVFPVEEALFLSLCDPSKPIKEVVVCDKCHSVASHYAKVKNTIAPENVSDLLLALLIAIA